MCTECDRSAPLTRREERRLNCVRNQLGIFGFHSSRIAQQRRSNLRHKRPFFERISRCQSVPLLCPRNLQGISKDAGLVRMSSHVGHFHGGTLLWAMSDRTEQPKQQVLILSEDSIRKRCVERGLES